MEFVKRYLKKCWTTLVVCMVCQAILYAALFLEGVPADKLWYPMILSAAFAIAYFFFERYRTWHKDGILKQAKQNIDITMENLPEATSVIEQYCDSILQYLRIEGEGSDFLLEEYPVKPMVNQAVKYFARSFIGKGLSIKIDIPEGQTLVTDEKWLVFVLKQVLSNALKYTKEGGITITMPRTNIICISDTGIGISREDLPRITERGYTGYNGRMDKKATGIGLFLVDTIMKKLGGSVEITSELGQGTNVYLTIL